MHSVNLTRTTETGTDVENVVFTHTQLWNHCRRLERWSACDVVQQVYRRTWVCWRRQDTDEQSAPNPMSSTQFASLVNCCCFLLIIFCSWKSSLKSDEKGWDNARGEKYSSLQFLATPLFGYTNKTSHHYIFCRKWWFDCINVNRLFLVLLTFFRRFVIRILANIFHFHNEQHLPWTSGNFCAVRFRFIWVYIKRCKSENNVSCSCQRLRQPMILQRSALLSDITV